MVASRLPWRLPLAASIRRSTSASVRCSRVRKSRLGSRLGVTVRFTVAGVTSLRCAFLIYFTVPEGPLLVQHVFFEQSRLYLASAGNGRVYCDQRGAAFLADILEDRGTGFRSSLRRRASLSSRDRRQWGGAKWSVSRTSDCVWLGCGEPLPSAFGEKLAIACNNGKCCTEVGSDGLTAVRSVGVSPLVNAPLIPVISCVPATVPFETHRPRSPLESRPSNKTSLLRTVKPEGSSPHYSARGWRVWLNRLI